MFFFFVGVLQPSISKHGAYLHRCEARRRPERTVWRDHQALRAERLQAGRRQVHAGNEGLNPKVLLLAGNKTSVHIREEVKAADETQKHTDSRVLQSQLREKLHIINTVIQAESVQL